MSENQTQSHGVIRWETAVDIRNAPEERDRLRAALDAAKASDDKVVRIEVASRDDHVARQLVAATRKSAAGSGVSVVVTAEDGDWDNQAILEDAA